MKKKLGVLFTLLVSLPFSCLIGSNNRKKETIAVLNQSQNEDVKIMFPNVYTNIPGRFNQGALCVLIQYKDKNILIDAADRSEGTVNYIIDFLLDNNVSRIDHLIMTHPHGDHGGGIPEVINNFDIGRFYMKPVDFSMSSEEFRTNYDNAYLAYKYKVNSDNSYPKLINPHREGYHYDLDEEGYFEIYNCTEIHDNQYLGLDDNYFSMQIKFTYKNSSAFFGGDACSNSDELLMNKIGHCDIFQLQHHGDALPYNSQFLIDELSPKYAVVCCVHWHKEVDGIDRPTTDTVSRLIRGGVLEENILVCGNEGDMTFESDGESFTYVK